MLSSHAFARRYPSLVEAPRWFTQGSSELHAAWVRPFARGRPQVVDHHLELHRHLPDAGALLVSDDRLGAAEEIPRWFGRFRDLGVPVARAASGRRPAAGSERWVRTVGPLPPWRLCSEEAAPAWRWDLDADWSSWTPLRCGVFAPPAGCRWEAELGWSLTTGRRYPSGEYGSAIARGATDMPPMLAGPAVAVDPARHGKLELVVTASPTGPPGLPGASMAGGWSSLDDPQRAFERGVPVPLELDGQRRTITIWLDPSVSWRQAPSVRRLALVGADRPAQVQVHGVRVGACSAGEPPAG